ncbi:MAG: hypothetical protein KGH61_02160 [Candidatus Micrarchaeota archaeon]|nr:hypothetical protein [Candidatus Micrarchaeota archaeon]MDE1847732.1 hypothetical protein [Candidatus Micrarchaeota archaeon]MDE1864161.1 hypothetical protein [Candidatus Micrarchaeota archaeon]
MREGKQKLFPVQEIGSIAKPGWRVKGVSESARLGDEQIAEAMLWGRRLKVKDYGKLVELLERRSHSACAPTLEEKNQVREWSAIYALRLFESAGLDVVYSGEQWRVEMYEHLVQNVEGFRLLGSVQSFDNKYYTKAAVISTPRFVHPIYLDELKFVQKHTSLQIKVPITGPYTLVEWSFDEFYEKRLKSRSPGTDVQKVSFKARREFMLDFVGNVLRKEVELLASSGAKSIQIDEPAITTKPSEPEMELFVEAINELTHGIDGVTFSLHNCYSDYGLLARFVPELKDITLLSLEFANRDSSEYGIDAHSRPGYSDLRLFEDAGYKGSYALGVEHIHDYMGRPGDPRNAQGQDILETPELVRDRILYATKVVVDPARIVVNPDCGLRTRSWDVAYSKLLALSQGAKLAREAFE